GSHRRPPDDRAARRALSRPAHHGEHAGPWRGRMVRARAQDSARTRLSPVPRARLCRHAAPRRSGARARAARAGRHRRRTGRTFRHGPAAPPGVPARRRTRAAARSVADALHRGTAARCRAHHAARGHGLAAARSPRRGAGARVAHGAARRQLGPPVEQVGAAHAARRARRLERHPEAGSDRAAWRPAGAGRRHRRAVLRPVVGPHAVPLARRVLHPGRVEADPAVRPLCLLVALARHGERAGFRPRVGARHPLEQRPAAARRRHPGPSASHPPRRVARRGHVELPQPGDLGIAPRGRRGEGGLLRVAVLQRRGRRPQHQRVSRGGGRRQARAHRAAARDLDVQPGRDDSLPVSPHGERRAADGGPEPRGARPPAGGLAGRRRRRRRESLAVRRRLHPAVRPRGVRHAALCRRARAHRRRGGGIAAFVYRIPLYAVAAVLALNARTQLWRKYTRNRWRKQFKAWRRRVLTDMKKFAVERLRRRGRRVSPPPPPGALTPKPGRHRDPAKRTWGWDVEEAHEVRELATLLGRSGAPIIVGPWLSETGFELLYWIPFLAWMKAYGNLDADRMVVVSRGGAKPWYTHITGHYEEIFSFCSPEEFRRNNDLRIAAQQGRLKHLTVSPFDRELIRHVTKARGLSGAKLLHPSEMYRLFEHFWFQRTPVTLIEAFTQFSMLDAGPPSARRAQLPERYVAAKFYGNSALPDTLENRAFISRFLTQLTEHTDVVLLNTADRFDDHDDFPPSLKGRVHTIESWMRPEDNLAVQTEVIRGATAFVGTYGGFSYLAPLLGTDTIAFYSHPTGFRFDHLEVAKRVFAGLRCAAFVKLDTRSVDAVRLAFGRPLVSLVETR